GALAAFYGGDCGLVGFSDRCFQWHSGRAAAFLPDQYGECWFYSSTGAANCDRIAARWRTADGGFHPRQSAVARRSYKCRCSLPPFAPATWQPILEPVD